MFNHLPNSTITSYDTLMNCKLISDSPNKRMMARYQPSENEYRLPL